MIITDTKFCTGCGLCENICPVKAVHMQPDNAFGHLRPFVDEKKCISCSLCEKTCPSNIMLELHEIKNTYAAWYKDEAKHGSSSSGGAASAIYEHTLENNGWIVGVYINKNLEPEYKLTNDVKDIATFKGSKYVQVRTNDIYIQIKNRINNGYRVAFIGLPCHCAAVKKMVGSDCDKLLIVDLVCHGVPSFKSLQGHIERIEKSKNLRATSISFRDSEAGEVLSLHSNDKEFYKRHLHEDEYMHSFITGNLFAESCHNCKYASSKRVGDITIGDFWGIGKYEPFKQKTSRVSEMLINTEKGKVFFNELDKSLYIEQRLTKEALEGNAQLNRPSAVGVDRKCLLEEAKKDNLEIALVNKYSKMAREKYNKRKCKELIKLIATKMGLKYIIITMKNKRG